MKRDDRNYCFVKITRGPAPKMVVVDGQWVKPEQEPSSAAALVEHLLGKKSEGQGKVPMRTLVPSKRR
jgi:hypothetical protein